MKKKDIINIIKGKDVILDLDSALVIYGVLKECDNIDYYNGKDFNIINGIKLRKIKELVSCYEGKKLTLINRYIRSLDNYSYEKELISSSIKLIAGVDEVGRGPLVGPVVAACVILPLNYKLDGLTDSKKLSDKKREEFYHIIMKDALSVGIGEVSADVIDEINIYQATKKAMIMAINNLNIKPEHILIDAMKLDLDIPSTSIVKGDLLSISISAASVVAKVHRDNLMIELDNKYPEYDFKNNKGYPTQSHILALEKFGYLNEHRKSYNPVFKMKERKNKEF